MRLAIVNWYTRSVGGIATRLNTYRRAAMQVGDSCDILLSKCLKTGPQLFSERKWVYGGDTRIWIDGYVPHGERVQESIDFINSNYDAVCFGFLCPHPCPSVKEPRFLELLQGIKLPMGAFISDGFWDKYAEWGKLCLPYLNGIAAPVQSYADTLKGVADVQVIPFPFIPIKGEPVARSKRPLVVWPHQWKNIKGINEFLSIVPQLKPHIQVELYSSGIRYYQLRTTDIWKNAVGEDTFSQYNGTGRAIYLANVDLPRIADAYQRAWFTVSLQGMKSKKEAYKTGSYNNSEVESFYYGACSVLHESTLNTILPQDCYIAVKDETEIPDAIHEAIKSGFALDPERIKRAREFVRRTHWGVNKYKQLKNLILS